MRRMSVRITGNQMRMSAGDLEASPSSNSVNGSLDDESEDVYDDSCHHDECAGGDIHEVGHHKAADT